MAAMLDLLPLSDATKPMLMTIMNGKYAEALVLYAKHFCNNPAAVSAQITDLTETEVSLRHSTADGHSEDAVLPYRDASGNPARATSAGDCRRLLVEMARQASEATGVYIALPGAPGVDTPASASSKVPGTQVLNNLIDLSSLECLNQDDGHPLVNAVKGEADSFVQSDPDVDHQLLIKVGFRQPVKLKAICFHGSAADETAPKLVKVFLGRQSIGFDEAQDEKPTQVLDLPADKVEVGDPIELRFVNFQNVTTIQLFVESNFGAQVTKIQSIEFLGVTAESTDMKAFKPIKTA